MHSTHLYIHSLSQNSKHTLTHSLSKLKTHTRTLSLSLKTLNTHTTHTHTHTLSLSLSQNSKHTHTHARTHSNTHTHFTHTHKQRESEKGFLAGAVSSYLYRGLGSQIIIALISRTPAFLQASTHLVLRSYLHIQNLVHSSTVIVSQSTTVLCDTITVEECNELLAHCAVYTCGLMGTKLCVLIKLR